MVICLERGADCLLTVQLMPLHPKTPLSRASFKSRLVFPHCYRLIQVVLETHTHPFNCLLSGTTWVSWYQKNKSSLNFTEARDSEWQWHQLGHMQVCTALQTDNHTSTPPLSFLQAGCPSCHPTNSVKALKAWLSWKRGR